VQPEAVPDQETSTVGAKAKILNMGKLAMTASLALETSYD
jgi:hypothetical protein